MRASLIPLSVLLGFALACGGTPSYSGHEPTLDADGSTVLSTPGKGLRLVAVDDSDVFFVRGVRGDSELWAVPKQGGPTRWLGRPGHNVEALIPQGDWVYVATWDAIWRFDKQTGEYERVNRYAGERIEPRGMAVDDQTIAFASYDCDVYTVPVVGEVPVHLVSLGEHHCFNPALTLEGGWLYYAHLHQVGRVDLESGEVQVLSQDGMSVARSPLVVQDGAIYADDTISSIRRIDIATGQEAEVCQIRDHVWGFAVDGDELYFGATVGREGGQLRDRSRGGGAPIDQIYVKTMAGDGQGGVRRCELASGSLDSTLLTPAGETVTSIALDDTHIYWVDSDLGQVLRRPR